MDYLRSLGFHLDTRKDIDRDLAQAVAKFGQGAEVDRKIRDDLQSVIERASAHMYHLLIGKNKKTNPNYASGENEMPDESGDCQKQAEQYRTVLERVERVLAFNLRSKIAWGPDYNQAVKDIYDATRAALGKGFIRADDL